MPRPSVCQIVPNWVRPGVLEIIAVAPANHLEHENSQIIWDFITCSLLPTES